MGLADRRVYHLRSFDEHPRGVSVGLDSRRGCWMRVRCFRSFGFILSESESMTFRIQWQPNHGAAANGLSAVRSVDGHFPGRWVRSVSGFEAVAELIR